MRSLLADSGNRYRSRRTLESNTKSPFFHIKSKLISSGSLWVLRRTSSMVLGLLWALKMRAYWREVDPRIRQLPEVRSGNDGVGARLIAFCLEMPPPLFAASTASQVSRCIRLNKIRPGNSGASMQQVQPAGCWTDLPIANITLTLRNQRSLTHGIALMRRLLATWSTQTCLCHLNLDHPHGLFGAALPRAYLVRERGYAASLLTAKVDREQLLVLLSRASARQKAAH